MAFLNLQRLKTLEEHKGVIDIVHVYGTIHIYNTIHMYNIVHTYGMMT